MTDTLEMDAPQIADPLDPDPSAPYGRTEDGTLLDRNGKRAPHGLTKSGLRKDHAPRARKRSRQTPSRTSARTITTKRRHGLQQLTDLPKGILLGLGFKIMPGADERATTPEDAQRLADRQARATVMLADAVTLDMHAPTLADAVAQMAEENDRLAQVVDRIIEVGPFAAIGLAVGSFLAQIARNHQMVPAPVAAMLGASHDPGELAQVALASMEGITYSNGQQPTAA